MLSRTNKNILTGILVLILLNTYVFEIEILNVFIAIAVIAILIYSNRKVLKTLSVIEIISVLVFVATVIALLVGFFYFVGRPLIDFVTISWLNFIIKILLIIVVFLPALGLIYKGMRVITKNKFPVMETDLNKNKIENNSKTRHDEDIKQLINQGKTAGAIKLVRKRYGYSLLEARDYIEQYKN